MAIEEEFSIEIPDKDADSIHSSTNSPPSHLSFDGVFLGRKGYSFRCMCMLTNFRVPVDKAVEYILNQPDAH